VHLLSKQKVVESGGYPFIHSLPPGPPKGDFVMTSILSNTSALLIAPSDLHELVRGQEQEFVKRMSSIVRRESVTLDFAQVQRIDAAGIAALISLYGCAMKAGNRFGVINATPHVVEILTVVGLDRILISRDVAPAAQAEACFAQPAA
jgi:anti-anti-sigma regulatory factor